MRFALKTEKAFCHCVDARACWFSFVCIVDGLRGLYRICISRVLYI